MAGSIWALVVAEHGTNRRPLRFSSTLIGTEQNDSQLEHQQVADSIHRQLVAASLAMRSTSALAERSCRCH